MASNHAPVIDLHAHASFGDLDELARGHDGWQQDLEQRIRTLGESAANNRRLAETVYRPKFSDLKIRLAAMDAMGVDMQVVSTAPTQNYWYWADRELAQKLVALNNQHIADLCEQAPARLAGLGIAALQHPDLAAMQLEHAVRILKLRGVIVSTWINGMELADPRLSPFWSKAEELGALIFIHPAGCGMDGRLSRYYFSNVIGNPLETTVALSHLIFGGVLDRHPHLKLLAAHGGGYFPFYVSRFDHGWKVRPEAHTCEHSPIDYLRRLWFDSLIYQPEMLSLLIARAGSDRIVLGTDYPFDMGVSDPLQCLAGVAGLSQADRQAIQGETAARLIAVNAGSNS